jgi:hypothetical protein
VPAVVLGHCHFPPNELIAAAAAGFAEQKLAAHLRRLAVVVVTSRNFDFRHLSSRLSPSISWSRSNLLSNGLPASPD